MRRKKELLGKIDQTFCATAFLIDKNGIQTCISCQHRNRPEQILLPESSIDTTTKQGNSYFLKL